MDSCSLRTRKSTVMYIEGGPAMAILLRSHIGLSHLASLSEFRLLSRLARLLSPAIMSPTFGSSKILQLLISGQPIIPAKSSLVILFPPLQVLYILHPSQPHSSYWAR